MNDPYAYKAINPMWNLVDPLSVYDAAALIAGFDPHSVDDEREYFRNRETNLTDSDGITSLHTAQTALQNAVNAGHLKATIRRAAWERGWDEEPEKGEQYTRDIRIRDDDAEEAWGDIKPHSVKSRGIIYRVAPDWSLTTVTVDDVRAWLRGRGVRTGFFFPDAADVPDYLDAKHPRYAPRLAAAVNAWLAVTEAMAAASRTRSRNGCG